ncbi:peptidase M10 [Streptomyces longhuiensis]|uniref:peptidase M10 n=1 Tax=Streptomyces longhuiensis TaxID=2880933 RepID=UPI001D0B30E8|nr:peptidase M10 [Streptomyces longhuiensis]UDM05530.1 peptidase M10 [Streptomyces longhuiensis]
MQLEVPEPGNGVTLTALGATGNEASFQLFVSDDGRIQYPEPEEFNTGDAEASTSAVPSACDDSAYALLTYEWFGHPYKWYLGDGGNPGGMNDDDTALAFADAINNITRSTNDCGLADEVSAERDYQGLTTTEADISPTEAKCLPRDGTSTWDGGDLISDWVAVTCTFSEPSGSARWLSVESDVRYNTTDYDFTNEGGSATCSYKIDLRETGTHEAGHVFGLDHPGAGHDNLTMHANSFWCSTSKRTLGRGDVLGLRALY